MNKINVRVLAEIAIFAAIAFALDLIQDSLFGKVFANGGSIGIAMVPVFIIAYRRGLLPGVLCGLIVSVVQMLGGVYVFQGKTFDNEFLKITGPFFQIMLDYVLAYTVVGVAGAFAGLYHKSNTKGFRILWIIVGTVIGGTLKFVSHFLSGLFFWLDGYSKFMGLKSDTWVYSLVYNGAYSLPNIILCTTIMVIIAAVYPQLLKADDVTKDVFEEKEESKAEVISHE
ncbi:MAG: energy-coupled thiamine transporter ThiT [Acholeplasmatales bacterium]|nr:energy-coupled thiamine transporter ThiT [Acholeplasmatales bacterium]